MGELTPKQRAFCDFYIETGNATEAYKRAGYKSRSEAATQANACRLISNDKVRAFIEERISDKDGDRIAKQDEILQYLTRVMRREEKEYTVVTLRKVRTWYEEGKKFTEETEVPEVVEIPSRLSDSNKAAELLGKRYVLWKENIGLSGTLGVQIVDDIK